MGDQVRLSSNDGQASPSIRPRATSWIQVNSAGNTGWVTRRYVTVVLADEPDDDTIGTEIPTAVIGTWNIEWFKDGRSRGFSEDGQGGPSYGARTNDDYQRG